MADRQVRMMDIDQVIRRWSVGEKMRAIARDRQVQTGTLCGGSCVWQEEAGIRRGMP